MVVAQPYTGHPKIRLGFLSADFRLHATSVFFAPLLAQLDRNIFEVYALDITVKQEVFSDVRIRLLGYVDHHVPLQGLTDDEAAKQISSLEIDVLIDLAGLTAGARPMIVQAKPAPIQVAYLGFIGSSAFSSIDYLITTNDLIAPGTADCYQEKLLCLPGAYLPIAPDLITYEDVPLERSQCGLPDDAVVYCALVNTYKITPQMFECWLRILKKVENGVLWLIGDNQTVQRNLTACASAQGVDINRLIFTARIPPARYRTYLKNADILLDTHPYGNGATAREAILANLPILTFPGKTMMSRLTAHLMSHLDLSDLIASDMAQYEQVAIRLGHNPTQIAQYKKQMREAQVNSTLFDVDQFVLDFADQIKSIVK
jgi:predicted O-linked N-acetylglucosamine transferase (SPINDLY family)